MLACRVALMSEVDLHTHSIRSDGALEPAAVVALAASNGVRVLALSDHDTLAGVAEASAAAVPLGVRVIPAIEVNTESEWGDVHILGYFLDPADAALEERLAWLREHRARRVAAMVERLNAMGYRIALERVHELARGGALGRPHLATALLEAGHVATFDEAFTTLIAKRSPAYVPKVGLGPFEAIELVRAHGGVASLAHPVTARDVPRLVPLLARHGLAGIECHHPDVPPERAAAFIGLARDHDLAPTGGSDFHGRGEHGVLPGLIEVPRDCVEALGARQPR